MALVRGRGMGEHDQINATNEKMNPEGSVWHRWDPHIHMPGTLKEDRFTGDDAVAEYVKHLNDPRVIKTAITDAWAISDNKASFSHALEERG